MPAASPDIQEGTNGGVMAMDDVMPSWREALKLDVEKMGDEGWKSYHIVLPFRRQEEVEFRFLSFQVGRDDADVLVRHVGNVNRDQVAGLGRGMLLLLSVLIGVEGSSVKFGERRRIPWNHYGNPHTGRFEEVLDADGRPQFPYADFSDGTWHDRRPLA